MNAAATDSVSGVGWGAVEAVDAATCSHCGQPRVGGECPTERRLAMRRRAGAL
jgi:hypothetical protein